MSCQSPVPGYSAAEAPLIVVDGSESGGGSGSDGEVDSVAAVVASALHHEDRSRWKQMLAILRTFVGVKEIWRISLPASLLEPIPNLEYWLYLDRPDFFVQMSEPEDPVERFLAVLRYWLSKDLKHLHGKLCKPYNSVLGEQFICRWEVDPSEMLPLPTFANASPSLSASETQSQTQSTSNNEYESYQASRASSDDSASFRSCRSNDAADSQDDAPPPTPTPPYSTPNGLPSASPIVVTCINEQISHHPPASAFWYECKERGIVARGVDHLAISFTGAAVKVRSGDMADGVFVSIARSDGEEEYHLKHADAALNGWFRGNLYLAVAGQVVHKCAKTGIRCVLDYQNEKWTGKLKGAFTGYVARYQSVPQPKPSRHVRSKSGNADAGSLTPTRQGRVSRWFTRGTSTTSTPIDQRSPSPNGSSNSAAASTDAFVDDEAAAMIDEDIAVLGRIEGSWRGPVWFTPAEGKHRVLLLDCSELRPLPKIVNPISEQDPMESRRVWQKLTEALLRKDWAAAQQAKHDVEERQRELRRHREQTGTAFEPKYMALPQRGKPELKKRPPAH